MRRAAALMLVLAACGGEQDVAGGEAETSAHPATPPRTARAMPETPTPADAKRAADAATSGDLLADLAAPDLRAAAVRALLALDDDARGARFDEGLRHADPRIARTTATLVRSMHVSAAMRPVVAALLLDAALDPAFRDTDGKPVPLDAFASFADADALARLLDRLNGGASVGPGAECGDALALAGPEHLDAADRLARSTDAAAARIGTEIATHVRAYADPALHGDIAADAPPTRAAALSALAALREDASPFTVSDRGEVADRHVPLLALLETGARDEFLARLRTWAAAENPPGSAHNLLIDLADAQSAPRIATALARIRETSWAAVPWSRAATIRAPEIRAALLAHVADAGDQFPPSVCEALEGVASQDGLPVRGPWVFGVPRPAIERIREQILAGRPVEAFCIALAERPGEVIAGEGAIDDERARRHLTALRASHEVALWTTATLEAARSGDPSALETLRRGIARRDPVWIARIDDALPILFDLATAGPALADLIASNGDVAETVATRVLEPLYGWDGDWEASPGIGSPAARFRAWWTARGGRFVHSRIADRWVPAPR